MIENEGEHGIQRVVFIVAYLWSQSLDFAGFTITPIYHTNIGANRDEFIDSIETCEVYVDN